jgi:hypothetical protein
MLNDLHIFIGKVYRHLNEGEHLHEAFSDRIYALVQDTCQLRLSLINAFASFGGQDINHRLGPGEIYTAVEKGTLGEFAGFGKRNSFGENQLKDLLENKKTPVAVDFDHVFAGIRFWSPHEDDKNFIEDLAIKGMNYPAIIELVALERAMRVMRLEDLLQYGKDMLPAHPDDADAS